MFREARDIIDYGILFTGASFFFLNGLVIKDAVFTPYNILLLSVMFFLLYGNIVYSHRALLLKTIAEETEGENDYLMEFRKDSFIYVVFTLSLATLITVFGSYVAWYGSVGMILTTSQDGLFVYSVLFSIPVIILIYVLTEYLPDFTEKMSE